MNGLLARFNRVKKGRKLKQSYLSIKNLTNSELPITPPDLPVSFQEETGSNASISDSSQLQEDVFQEDYQPDPDIQEILRGNYRVVPRELARWGICSQPDSSILDQEDLAHEELLLRLSWRDYNH